MGLFRKATSKDDEAALAQDASTDVRAAAGNPAAQPAEAPEPAAAPAPASITRPLQTGPVPAPEAEDTVPNGLRVLDGFVHPEASAEAEAVVLLTDTDLDWHELSQRITRAWGVAEPTTDDGRMTWEDEGDRVTLELVPEPYAPSEIETAVRGNLFWRDGYRTLRGQVAHLTLHGAATGGPVRVRALMSKIIAGCVSDPVALAAYVPDAHIVVEPVMYLDAVEALRNDDLPGELWVNVTVTVAEGEGTRGWTRGLTSFGHAELEVLRSRRDLSGLYQALAQITDYVVAGNELHPGDVVAGPDGEDLQVEASESVLYDEPTLKLSL